MNLIQLLYVSSGVGRVSEQDIKKILNSARRNNTESGVTGMLLFCDDNFLQLLEGSPAAVEATFSRIKRNPLHTDIHVLLRDTVDARSFENWSMGFDRVSGQEIAPSEAAFEISRKAIKGHMTSADSWEVRRMMENFYNINTRLDLHLAES
jgi:hypothetical protein